MKSLELNKMSKDEYFEFLVSVLPTIDKDYLWEISDYAFSKFENWKGFVLKKYKLLDLKKEIFDNCFVFMFFRSLIDVLKRESLFDKDFLLNQLNNQCYQKTNMYLNYDCELGENLDIYKASRFSIKCNKIGNNCEFENGILINKKESDLFIMDRVKIKSNAIVMGGLTLESDSEVSENCVLTNSLKEGEVVKVVNQLQISTCKNKIYSQKLEVYGIIPKFKNTFIILGEGFYNPTVLIKLKNTNKELKYFIDYWDKNKIIIKIKNTIPFMLNEVKNCKIIILSNDEKTIILNNVALEKCLCNLKN